MKQKQWKTHSMNFKKHFVKLVYCHWVDVHLLVLVQPICYHQFSDRKQASSCLLSVLLSLFEYHLITDTNLQLAVSAIYLMVAGCLFCRDWRFHFYNRQETGVQIVCKQNASCLGRFLDLIKFLALIEIFK